MVNDELNGGYEELGRPINPKGDKIGLLKENSLSGQKILIVMLWSCSLSEQENKLVDPKYIEKPSKNNVKSIKNSTGCFPYNSCRREEGKHHGAVLSLVF